MTICAREGCGRWRAGRIVRRTPGLTVDGAWFCSCECVERIARLRLLAEPAERVSKADEPLQMRLGAWLRHNGAVSAEQLALALVEQQRTGLRLGEQLCALGFVEPEAVLRALAQQSGVPYLTRLDPAAVRRGPGGLSRDAVRALAVVPFSEPIDGRIKVACAAPVRWSALSAFRQITGMTPQPHLVADAHHRALIDAYGLEADTATTAHFLQTNDLSVAAASIARAAAAGGAARLTEARCDPFTWVRVLVASGVHDVVFAVAKGQ